jgi:hypothetical protein
MHSDKNSPPPKENFSTITSKPILGLYMDQPLVSTMVSNTIPPWYQMFKNSFYPITPLVSNSKFVVILQRASELWIL